MPLGMNGPLGWWSPDPRGVLELGDLHVSRSLRRSLRRFEIRVDTAFEAVIDGCRTPDRPDAWISEEIRDAYVEMHRLGWAHSIEAWDAEDRLVGGLYGIAIGGLFAGESMFHAVTDGSKAALAGTVGLLDDGRPRLFDVQWTTPHLASLGVTDIDRATYLRRLEAVLDTPLPEAFGG